MKEYTLLMLAHMLGDYYFQPQCLAKLKSRNTLYVLIHAGIYAAVMFSTLLLCYSNAYLYAVAACAVTHAVIDIVKQLILNGAAKRGSLTVKQDRAAYLIDQALHLSIILAVSFTSAFYGEGRGIEFLQKDITKNAEIIEKIKDTWLESAVEIRNLFDEEAVKKEKSCLNGKTYSSKTILSSHNSSCLRVK